MKLFSFVVFLLILGCEARPPRKIQTPAPNQPEPEPHVGDPTQDLEYNRYLQEVIQTLESDSGFRKKLENATAEEIRDGTIAKDIDLLDHRVRTKLDEVKAKEMQRLFKLHKENIARGGEKLHPPNHVDLDVHDRFRKEDLEKLIKAVTKDLDEADVKRRQEYHRYKMEDRFEEEERLKHIENENDRKAEENRLREMKEKHKKHEKVHHPLSKAQVEEVWEKQDHMDKKDFDAETFFKFHDLNEDGYLNQQELLALLSKELDKVYSKDNPEDDMMDRQEELERMREHVVNQTDTDGDKMISFKEFMGLTKGKDWDEDEGWDTLDEVGDEFTEEEFKEFQEERRKEIKEALDRGVDVQLPGQPAYAPNPSFQQRPREPAPQPQVHNSPQQPGVQPPVAVKGQPVGQPQGQPVGRPQGQPVGQP